MARTPNVTAAVERFFNVLRNTYEMTLDARRKSRDDEVPPPATLASAVDSLRQAPDDVLVDWFGVDDVSAVLSEVLNITQLVCAHGPDMLLADLLDR